MRNVILSGVMLAVLAGGALAQANPDPPPSAPADLGAAPHAPPPPRPGPGATDEAGSGAPPPPDGLRGHRPPPPPPGKAAHFRLERGDLALDVKCAEDEPMKACADIALQLLDKAQSVPKP